MLYFDLRLFMGHRSVEESDTGTFHMLVSNTNKIHVEMFVNLGSFKNPFFVNIDICTNWYVEERPHRRIYIMVINVRNSVLWKAVGCKREVLCL